MTAASLFSYGAEPINAESLRQSQGELLLQIEQLRQETQALRGLMEELSYQLGQMSSDQKSRYLDLDQRLGELVRIQKEAVAASSSNATALTATDLAASDASNNAGTPVSPIPEVSDQDAYNAAFQLIRERKFEEALEVWRPLLKRILIATWFLMHVFGEDRYSMCWGVTRKRLRYLKT
jgi:TolA-binding protein